MILTHLAQPILAETTDLRGLCGAHYARRDPRTLEVWHTALAIPPTRLAYMQRVWGTQYAYCPACVALAPAEQTDPPPSPPKSRRQKKPGPRH